MRILITGATGLIGRAFISAFQHKYQFTALCRNPATAELPKTVSIIDNLSNLQNLDDFDIVINLQGEPIFGKRWSTARKNALLQSRVFVTQTLTTLFNNSEKPPSVFISGSAIGYYGRQSDISINESFDSPYPEFSHQLCKQWEQAASKAKKTTRVCLLRTGIVLSNRGGALDQMVPPAKFGLAAVIGDGRQYMSWIHIDDMVNAIDFIADHSEIEGPVNLTAPKPVSNREFTDTLSQALKKPRFLSVPGAFMRVMLGEGADLLTFGQHVIPSKLERAGYTFRFPTLKPALTQILAP
ncbi:TIGR01777 family oxidoreductase [Thalassotalea euphylliae]|uniref:TIGR01777 family oxidoreductase n=1 Tax=Thalassotalea euphylliae TaxID=1655234 RepID=UPI003637D943